MDEREQLEQAIAALEGQRAVLGDAVVDAGITSIREKLAKLQQPAPPPIEQRKQVTVLFADLPGFTAMSETMDAEEVNSLMNALWQRLDRVITKHNGRIDKHMGDGVMALWGVNTSREDDPIQAVMAALAMQMEISSWRTQIGQNKSLPNLPQGLRVGINTGPVILSQVGLNAEFTAIGDTVNMASRLETAAPTGGILISENTYAHVRNLFHVDALDPLTIKGKTTPVIAYRVRHSTTPGFHTSTRGIEGIATRMVGRRREMAQLQATFEAVLSHGRRHMTTLVGDAGVGKSRLLYEFEGWLERHPTRLQALSGRARLETKNLPYALIRDLFVHRFDIQESDAAPLVRRKMERGMSECLPGEVGIMAAHFVGQLIGFDFRQSPHLAGILNDARQIRDRAIVYLSQYISQAAVTHPLVILLEDIHWADDSSLDIISHLAHTTAQQPLLFVCLTRPVLFERRPLWCEDDSYHSRLPITPLSPDDSHQLVSDILQKVLDVPVALQDLIVSKAEGNPFYLEEIIKMLIQDGVIVKESPYWQIQPERLNQAHIPTTLTGVLQAALDRLHPEELMVLQQASVVGRTFWDGVLTRINQYVDENLDEEDVQNTLSALRGREMIYRRRTSAFARTQELIFKHALLREVTYETVLKRMRRTYHALVAEWLIERSGDRLNEYAGLIADHLELAGETGQAITYLRRAGLQAAAQFANSEAIVYLSRALDLTPLDHFTERYTLLQAREKVYELQGNREAQQQDLVAMVTLVTTQPMGESQVIRWRAEVALRQAHYAGLTSDYATTIAAAQTAIELAQQAGDVGSEAAGHLRWGWALRRQWQNGAARQQLLRALELARTAQLPQTEADCLRSLGVLSDKERDYMAAYRYYDQALQIYQTIGDRRGEGHTLSGLGGLANKAGDYVRAQDFYERDLTICRQIGDKAGEGWALSWLGSLAHRQGAHADARGYYEGSLQVRQQIGAPLDIAFTLSRLGSVGEDQGNFAYAQHRYTESLAVYRAIPDLPGESWVVWWLSGVLLAQGHYSLAWQYAQEALTVRQKLADARSEAYAWYLQGRVMQALGLYDEAYRFYQKGLDIFDQLADARGQAYVLANLSLQHHQLEDNERAYEYGRQALLVRQRQAGPQFQATLATHMGHALAGLGRLEEAAAVYQEAITIWVGRNQYYRATEPRAGLARIALAYEDINWAIQQITPVLHHLENQPLAGVDEPFRVYLTCYHVLRAHDDNRAIPFLKEAYRQLQTTSARISDPHHQHCFLNHIPAHQALMDLRFTIDRNEGTAGIL